MNKNALNYALIFNDITQGVALRFDFDFYGNQLRTRKDVPLLALTNKLAMWIYYKNNPHKVEINLIQPSEELRQYQKEISKLVKKGVQPDQFDSDYYLSLYPDVSNYKVEFPVPCFHHWLCFGIFEHRLFKFNGNLPQVDKDESIQNLNTKETIVAEVIEPKSHGSKSQGSKSKGSKSQGSKLNSTSVPKVGVSKDSQYVVLHDVIQVALSRYITNKLYKQQMASKLLDYCQHLINDMDTAHDFFHWEREQVLEFMGDFFKLINLKGYLDHISVGIPIESIMRLLSSKLELSKDKFQSNLRRLCSHTLTTCPICNEGQNANSNTQSNPVVSQSQPVSEDFLEFLKKVQEKSIEETILSLKKYQEMKTDQTYDAFKHIHEHSMQEIVESVKKLIRTESASQSIVENEIKPSLQVGMEPANRQFLDEFRHIQESSTKQIMSLLSQNLNELKGLNSLQAQTILSQLNKLSEVHAIAEQPIEEPSLEIRSVNLPIVPDEPLIPRQVSHQNVKPIEQFPSRHLADAEIDQFIEIWKNLYSRINEKMPSIDLNIMASIEILFSLDQNRYRTAMTLLSLFTDSFDQLFHQLEIHSQNLTDSSQTILFVDFNSQSLSIKDWVSCVGDKQKLTAEDIHQLELYVGELQNHLLKLQTHIDQLHSSGERHQMMLITEFIDNLIMCLQESIYHLMDRSGQIEKFNQELVKLIQFAIIERCQSSGLNPNILVNDNYQLIADQFSSYYQDHMGEDLCVPISLENHKVKTHLNNFIGKLINP